MVEWQIFYEKNNLVELSSVAVVEPGETAGGDGGGFNLVGEDGFGRRSGKGGAG